MSSTTTTAQIPGYVAGNWTIDPAHSEIGFTVRHMMLSKVRGKFASFEGAITTAPELLDSQANVTIDMSSITTGNEQRDGHLRSADFFDAENHPQMSFRSTGLRAEGGSYLLDGELTIRGITKPVTLSVDIHGVGPDNYGGTRAGFTAEGEISRKDFGVNWNDVIEGGGVVVSDKVQIILEIQAVLGS